MKTLEEFVKEINASEELKKEILALEDQASLEAFLKKNGCNATAEEFVKAMTPAEGELSDNDAGSVAGGVMSDAQLLRKLKSMYPQPRCILP